MQLSRRHFLLGSAATAAAAATAGAFSFFRRPAPPIAGGIVGASSKVGHLLRSGGLPQPKTSQEERIVIVGGGIAGLSAAWKLKQANIPFTLLELEDHTGGNASSGENAVSAYPWGAHYVPLPTEESVYVRELFEELGLITGYDAKGAPIYNEYHLCADPHERLFLHGRWQEGLVPVIGAEPRDHEQYKSFFAAMRAFRDARGSDGKKAFTIPLDFSSADARFRSLDSISMRDWLNQQGYDSQKLHWYINYCCRDDYGTTYDQASAWAGIHYFAARGAKASNTEGQSVLTWPQGNGWLAQQLRQKIEPHIQTGTLAYKVRTNGMRAQLDCYDTHRQDTFTINADAAILAVPHFVADRLLSREPGSQTYAPWMVANITLSRMPGGKGEPLSWDNVIYNSDSLGYVVATHQNLNRVQHDTVITYYWPLSALPPKEARQQAIARPYEEWQAMILKELLRVHPELSGHVQRVDVWLWGHGMIRPTLGYVWGDARQAACRQQPPLFFAHSDMSGISIFEEAQYRGVTAALAVKKFLA